MLSRLAMQSAGQDQVGFFFFFFFVELMYFVNEEICGQKAWFSLAMITGLYTLYIGSISLHQRDCARFGQ